MAHPHNRPLTTAAQNFFSQFNAGQEIRRRREQEENRVQAIIEAAELKRQQELDDREDLALSIEQSLGIDISDVPATPTREPQVVEDTGIFPAPQRTGGADGIEEEDITRGGITIPGSPTGAERRGPGRKQDFTFTQKQRKAFSEAIAINPSVSTPILNFLTMANDFQLQQESNRTARKLRGALFLQDQLKKSPVLFQEGIRRLMESGVYGPQEVEALVELSNETNQDLVNLKLEKLVLDNTPTKILLEEEIAKRKGLREELATIRTEGRAEQTQIREEKRKPSAPLTQIAKLNADFTAGRITAEQRTAGIAKAVKADSLVNVQAFQRESEKLGARSDASVRDEVRGNARTASRSLSRVRNLSKLLKEAPAGALTQFAPQFGRLIPFFDATDEQAAQAQVNAFVLDQMKAFKGSTSDRELQFAETTVARLGNTREANEIILRSFENVIFLAQQENKQFDEFLKGGGKGRDFIFDFQKVLFPGHPKFGDVTLDDIQTTAFENGITMEDAIRELRKR